MQLGRLFTWVTLIPTLKPAEYRSEEGEREIREGPLAKPDIERFAEQQTTAFSLQQRMC